METRIEYKAQVHILDLAPITTQQQLIALTRATFALQLPNFFEIRVDAPDGKTIDEPLLAQVKRNPMRKINLFVVEQSQGLIEIKSPHDAFFTEREEHLSGWDELKGLSGKNTKKCGYNTEQEKQLKGVASPKREYGEIQSIVLSQIEDKQLISEVQGYKQCKREEETEEKQLLHRSQITGGKLQQTNIINLSHQDVVFENLQCDRCFVFPIRGPAYKCLVCPNFDLCKACHERYHSFHPLLEITTPSLYPTQLRVVFEEKAEKYMKGMLKQQQQMIRQQKIENYQRKQRKIQVIDSETLPQEKVRQPSFLAFVLGGSYSYPDS